MSTAKSLTENVAGGRIVRLNEAFPLMLATKLVAETHQPTKMCHKCAAHVVSCQTDAAEAICGIKTSATFATYATHWSPCEYLHQLMDGGLLAWHFE